MNKVLPSRIRKNVLYFFIVLLISLIPTTTNAGLFDFDDLTPFDILHDADIPDAGGLLDAAESIPVGLNVPFGGPIITVLPCLNGGLLIYFYDFRTKIPQIINLQAGFSRIYMFFSFLPGNNILGTYTSGTGVCVISGIPVPTFGAINFTPGVGTSAFPSF